MKFPKDMLDELVDEAKADEVGLWFIISRLRNDLAITDSLAIKEATLMCVEQLLRTGAVVAGSYSGHSPEIEPWPLDTAGVLARISREWDQLGHEPSLGDIVVLQGK